MNNLGKHLNIKKRVNPLEEKELFCELIDLYEYTIERSKKLYQEHGLEFQEYDENFLLIIDNLLYLKYGQWKTEIINWYLWERIDEEGNIGTLEYQDNNDKTSGEIIIKCAEDLWDILQKLNSKLE